MWQAEQLKSLQKYRFDNKKQFSGYFSTINDQIEEMLLKSYVTGNMEQEIKILKAIKRGYKANNIPDKIRELIKQYGGMSLKDIAGSIISKIRGEKNYQQMENSLKLMIESWRPLLKQLSQI